MGKKLRVTLATALTAVALLGCTTQNDSGDEVSSVSGKVADGAKAQVMQTAARVGTELAGMQADTGTYPAAPTGVVVQDGSQIVGYQLVPPGDVRFCVVHATTGAWAVYDSTRGGVTSSGDSGATCA